MLMQNDPFELFFRGLGAKGESDHRVEMDAYRRGSDVWVHIDLPGVPADAVDISVERSVLTVTAERKLPRQDGDQRYLSERAHGTFRRQVHLGENLDVSGIEADFADGVLTLRIPVSEQAKARKIAIGTQGSGSPAVSASTETSTIEAEAEVPVDA
ncbi:MAG: Hsp20/alpha crystallin family protein [Acidimicrobiales bacterium]